MKNPDTVKRAVQSIRAQVKVIADHPAVGRPVSDLPEPYREWTIDLGDSGYIARYRLEGTTAVILAVWINAKLGKRNLLKRGARPRFHSK